MAVGLPDAPERLRPVAGIRLACVASGIRYQGRDDLLLIALPQHATCAAVFTRNAFCAAPVLVARDHLARARPRYLLINAGNANAGTGDPGVQVARSSCQLVAAPGGCAAEQVLPFSTGVIAEPLPVERFAEAMPALFAALGEDRWNDAARAIMTTDTVAKGLSRQVMIGDRPVTVTGIAKGSGMIRPDMATMLAYIATDAAVEQELLQQCLEQAVALSFNSITVDGDTSTNDACVLMASGAAGIEIGADALPAFQQAVNEVATWLAQAVVRDGEGATKFITIEVRGGRDEAECRRVADTIAHSPLVKTAFFASDPNWGRILAAVGRAEVADFDLSRVAMYLDDVCIVNRGGRAPDYTEERGQTVMSRDEITVRVELGRGAAACRIWTCDLSYDYVRINADYRS